MPDDEKAIQNAKGERRDREEIHRSNALAMIPQEGQPALEGIWPSQRPPKPSRDGWLGKAEAQLEQFAMDAWCSPGGILGSHAEDQGANLFANTLSASRASGS